MSKSNWNGSSSWGTIEDPTGALNGRVLVVTAGACDSAEDYLIQYVGTSDTFSKANYKACAYYAFPTGTDAFAGGKFGVIARAGSLTGSPETAQNCYIGLIDNESKKFKIIKRSAGVAIVLAECDMLTSAVTAGYRHKIDLICTGAATVVSLKLSIDDRIVLSASDNTSTVILSGYTGLYIEAGTTYVDSFIVYEYTIDGLAPATWQPSNGSTSLSVWLKHDTGITQSSGTISQWADQSGNSNNANQSTVNQQPEAVTGLGISSGTFLKFVSGGSGFEKNLVITDSATVDLNATGLTIFAFIRPLTYGVSSGGSTVDIGYIADKDTAYSLGTANDTAGTPANSKTLIANLNTSVSGTVYAADNAIQELNTWYIVGIVSDIGSAANTSVNGFFINGSYSANSTTLSANTSTDLIIGAKSSGSLMNMFNGYMTEVIIYQGELTTSDRQKVEGYIAHKFGVQTNLPLTHPYRTIKPTV